jgi:hypothetical protein
MNGYRSVRTWTDLTAVPARSFAESARAVAHLQAALADIPAAVVVSASLVTTGEFDPPQYYPEVPASLITDLPDFWDVRVDVTSPGGYVASVMVWLPVKWNGRFLGTTGGGNRTPSWLGEMTVARCPNLVDAIRNGFAAALTDGGNRDDRRIAWGLDLDTGRIDWDLTENWIDRSTHEMTLVAKRIVESLYGEPAAYSYLVGTSGGGRQTLAIAQRFPADYDGYWADAPAIYWSRLALSGLWPFLVMKESGNALSLAKLEFFRRAAINSLDDGDGIVQAVGLPQWDPFQVVGDATADGPITALDAKVMQSIWAGPRSRTGEWLWFGPAVGADCRYLAATEDLGGRLTPVPSSLGFHWASSWLLKDPDWDATGLSFEQFDALWEQSIAEFASLDVSEADLTGLRDSGGKLLLSHGLGDELIPPGGTVHYYERVRTATPDADDVVAFFLAPGDPHSVFTGPGPGITVASSMAALMGWVENGTPPTSILGVAMDPESFKVTATRPIARYPELARHVGGDRRHASSFSTEPG